MGPAPTPTSTTAEDAIRAVVSSANEHQDDPDGLLALHTDDTVIVNLAGRRVAGRDTFGAVMRRSLHGRLGNVRTSVEVEDIMFLQTDVAVVSCTKHVTDDNPDAEAAALPTRGALTYVMVDDGPGWRIALAQTTPVASA